MGWKNKKLLIAVALVALVLVVVSIGGAVLAQEGTTTSGNTLFARVAAILGIDQSKLESAFTQARSEMQQEALDNYLKSLVEQGKLTQAQADQYKTWWQSKPDVPIGPGCRGRGGFRGMPGGWCNPPVSPTATPTSN